MSRHWTPLPVPTLEGAWHRIDRLADDIDRVERSASETRERAEALLAESIRTDERLKAIESRLQDHSGAVKKFRSRDAQLVMLGVIATAVLAAVLRFFLH